MSYEFYKVLHLIGIAWLMVALGGATGVMILGSDASPKLRKLVGASHGISLLIIFVAGFGLLAKGGVSGFPGWVIAKIGIWIVFGGLIAVIRRKPQWGTALWFALPALVGVSAWLAIVRPF